jgi:vancomycin resistance protein VanJ
VGNAAGAAGDALPAWLLRPPGIADFAALGYLAASLLAVVVVRVLAETWWPATVYLFGPRWLLLLPIPLFAAAAMLSSVRALVPLAAGALIVLFPVMGLNAGARLLLPGGVEGDTLRVVTFNMAGNPSAALSIAILLEAWEPDVMALQECDLDRSELSLPGWHGRREGSLCLFSRYPIESAEAMSREGLLASRRSGVGGAGHVLRYRIARPDGPLHVVVLHLETPRKGLEALYDGTTERLAANTTIRTIEARRARAFYDATPRPAVLVGDFNTPVESRIYRESWGDLTNAFSRVGRGFGFTKLNGWIRVRIDHVLTTAELQPIRARVAPAMGSDHLPVIVDLVLKR